MIHPGKINWDQVSINSQQWINVEILKVAVSECLGDGTKGRPIYFNAKDPSKVDAWVDSSQGVFLGAKDDADESLVRKLALVTLKLADDMGVHYAGAKDDNHGRPCPKCKGAFRSSVINQEKSELVCANPKCRYAVMETRRGGRVNYIDWFTGKEVRL